MFDGLRSGNKYWTNRINELNGRCIDLEQQLAVAKSENERLSAEVKAHIQGRDEQDAHHEGIIIEYLEQIQHLLDTQKVLEEKLAKHDAECLPSL